MVLSNGFTVVVSAVSENGFSGASAELSKGFSVVALIGCWLTPLPVLNIAKETAADTKAAVTKRTTISRVGLCLGETCG